MVDTNKPATMSDNVYLFVPNLIGYARVILAIISFYFMPTDYVVATLCYITSALLDAVDGHAARLLGQSSKFGAMLDQLTDRCATMCLLVTLSYFYPAWMFWFQMAMALDIASHWLHLHSSLMQGRSHKNIDLSGNPFLRLYYTSRPFLFVMCSGNELFFSMLYLLYFTSGPIVPVLGVGMWKVICVISFPIMAVKAAISLLHLCVAAENIVRIDLEDRELAKNK